jgi:hypothetical protein
MNSLTLNCTVTQLRCKFSQSGFEYEAMINHIWTPVSHKFVEFLWPFLLHKKRALVKINSLSYIVIALAKSSAKLGSLEFIHAHNRAFCGFFVHSAQLHFNGGLGEGAERLAGCVYNRSANLAQFTSSLLGSSGGELLKLIHEGCLMTTIPNEIVPTKSLSIDQIDIINRKLTQLEAIIYLLSVNSKSEIKINEKLVSDALWAISDLVADARYFLNNDNNKEVNP